MSRASNLKLYAGSIAMEGASIRAFAELHGAHRRTVREAIVSAVAPPRKTPDRHSPTLGPWTGHDPRLARKLTSGAA